MAAHFTPGHTPGSTTWTWRSCEGPRCVNVVYADSLNPVSAPGFKYTQQSEGVETFRDSINKIRSLPCDVLLSVHPGFARTNQKALLLSQNPVSNPFVDSAGCRGYADTAAEALERRILEEK